MQSILILFLSQITSLLPSSSSSLLPFFSLSLSLSLSIWSNSCVFLSLQSFFPFLFPLLKCNLIKKFLSVSSFSPLWSSFPFSWSGEASRRRHENKRERGRKNHPHHQRFSSDQAVEETIRQQTHYRQSGATGMQVKKAIFQLKHAILRSRFALGTGSHSAFGIRHLVLVNIHALHWAFGSSFTHSLLTIASVVFLCSSLTHHPSLRAVTVLLPFASCNFYFYFFLSYCNMYFPHYLYCYFHCYFHCYFECDSSLLTNVKKHLRHPMYKCTSVLLLLVLSTLLDFRWTFFPHSSQSRA